MAVKKTIRPAFQSVEVDGIDARLEAKAAEKGIPTLVAPNKVEKAELVEQPKAGASEREREARKQATPRSRMKALKIELPDYVWVALKKQAAEKMVSLRHVIMTSLREQGVAIDEADMIEDGRRLR